MLQKCSVFRVADVFFDEPLKKHNLKDVCTASSLSPTSVNIHLRELLRLKLIVKVCDVRGRRSFPLYSANINSPVYKKYKKIFNILKIEESGIVEKISDKVMPKAIVLFGSYSRGEDTEGSDIDIYIQGKKQEFNLKDYERRFKRKIQLLFNENFSDYSNELKNNISNGVVLKGYLEVFLN